MTAVRLDFVPPSTLPGTNFQLGQTPKQFFTIKNPINPCAATPPPHNSCESTCLSRTSVRNLSQDFQFRKPNLRLSDDESHEIPGSDPTTPAPSCRGQAREVFQGHGVSSVRNPRALLDSRGNKTRELFPGTNAETKHLIAPLRCRHICTRQRLL